MKHIAIIVALAGFVVLTPCVLAAQSGIGVVLEKQNGRHSSAPDLVRHMAFARVAVGFLDVEGEAGYQGGTTETVGPLFPRREDGIHRERWYSEQDVRRGVVFGFRALAPRASNLYVVVGAGGGDGMASAKRLVTGAGFRTTTAVLAGLELNSTWHRMGYTEFDDTWSDGVLESTRLIGTGHSWLQSFVVRVHVGFRIGRGR